MECHSDYSRFEMEVAGTARERRLCIECFERRRGFDWRASLAGMPSVRTRWTGEFAAAVRKVDDGAIIRRMAQRLRKCPVCGCWQPMLSFFNDRPALWSTPEGRAQVRVRGCWECRNEELIHREVTPVKRRLTRCP